jgi:hypothetical protein
MKFVNNLVCAAKKTFLICSLLVLVFSIYAPLKNQAAPMTPKMLQALNDWTNWVGDSCSGPSSDGSTGTPITGETTGPAKAVQQVVWNTLVGGGIDPIHAAAVMGNIANEGVWDPESIENVAGLPPRSKNPADAGSYGYGLIGWTPGASKTINSSLTYQMKELGLDSEPPYTAETQSAVILAQIRGKTSAYPASKGRDFLNTKTVEQATIFYEGDTSGSGFENPADPAASQAARIASAKQLLREFGGTTPSSTGGGAIASSGVCCPPGGSATPGSPTSASDNEATVWNFLVTQMKLSSDQAAGIMGNMEQESGFNPTIVNSSSGAYGIIQWLGTRLSGLESFAQSQGKDKSDINVQLQFMQKELEGSYKSSVLDPIQKSSSLEDVVKIWLIYYEAPCLASDTSCVNNEMSVRVPNAKDILQKYGNGAAPVSGQSSCGAVDTGSADLSKTITVDTPGKFITLPSKYTCPGYKTKIDSRIAADVAYLATTYNLCTEDGLADGHLSHGAGVAVDMIPKNGNSKQDWQNSAEAAAKAIGWWGDSATDPKGKVSSCANYGATDYGQCMHEVYPDKFPQWMRWMGYNGAYLHGDPWHVYPGGAGPHIHIGWDTPNHDGVSSTIISQPRASVYAFPVPVPSDLQGLVN